MRNHNEAYDCVILLRSAVPMNTIDGDCHYSHEALMNSRSHSFRTDIARFLEAEDSITRCIRSPLANIEREFRSRKLRTEKESYVIC